MNIKIAALLSTALLTVSMVAGADVPGRHPHYLHALADLRTARWLISHGRVDNAVGGHEHAAMSEIDLALYEIKHAAIDDGKDPNDHGAIDESLDAPGRLHNALNLLNKVRSDISTEQDDPNSQGLRVRAVDHVTGAIHETEIAIHDLEDHR